MSAPTSISLFLVLTLVACAAPRDPELERRVLRGRAIAERQAAEQKVAAATPPPPAPAVKDTPASPPRNPLKSFSGADVQRILGAVQGVGARVIAAFDTDLGTLTCTLDTEQTPETVANFVGLATGQLEWKAIAGTEPAKTPYYDGQTFYRTVANFLVEGGKALSGRLEPAWRVVREPGGADKFKEPGAIAMLASGDGQHASRFFIMTKADPQQAEKYTAFGVCNEVDLVKRIADAPQVSGQKDTPQAPVVIKTVRVYRGD